MFNRLTNFLAQAAEVTSQVLVGQQTREEEFQGHWKTITNLISDSEDDESCMTEVSAHLDRMADLLFHEEEDNNVSMGPCMEFLIRHKLLDTLGATAKSDFPAGMRKAVFRFLSLLLGRIQQPLLPHIAVHRPINTLVKTCGLTFINPLAVDEIQFLRTLCLTLRADPTLANFFLEETNDKSCTTFTVAETLMRISNSEESLVCLKAFECLLLCVSLQTVSPVMSRSQFPLLIASKMRQHLQLLPSSLDCADVLNCRGGWGVNYASSTAVQCLSPSPHQPLLHLEAYLSWLDYCEQVISASAGEFQDSICECIKEQVLEAVLLPKLSLASEVDLIMAMTLISLNLLRVSHSKLAEVYIQFVLVQGLKPLTQSCNHLNEDICCASLILLNALLQRPILPNLFPLQHTDNHTLTKKHIENSVKSYLGIVPSHLVSALEVEGDSGLTYYLMEAHQQVSICHELISEWEGSTGNAPTLMNISEQEHPLITGLLDRLERLLDQTYELNLHLTSVLSCLAAYPQMEPLFDVRDDCALSRNVYTVLQKVGAKLQSHAERTPGFQLNITEARRRLTGQETSDLLSMPKNEQLEGAVVLEEFCKEIAATLYVRYSTKLVSEQSPNQ